MQRSYSNPGCFGSPLCYADTSPLCNSCMSAEKCSVASAERAKSLRDRYGITPLLLHSRRKPKIVESQSIPKTEKINRLPEIRSLDQKISKLADSVINNLTENNIDLKTMVRSRQNVWDRQPNSFMRVAIDLLYKGMCKPYEIARVLREEFKWSDNVANLNAKIATQVLLKTGAAYQERNRLALSPCYTEIKHVLQ